MKSTAAVALSTIITLVLAAPLPNMHQSPRLILSGNREAIKNPFEADDMELQHRNWGIDADQNVARQPLESSQSDALGFNPADHSWNTPPPKDSATRYSRLSLPENHDHEENNGADQGAAAEGMIMKRIDRASKQQLETINKLFRDFVSKHPKNSIDKAEVAQFEQTIHRSIFDFDSVQMEHLGWVLRLEPMYARLTKIGA